MATPEPQGFPVPPHVHQAQAQLAAALEKVEGKPVDLLKTPWAEVEKIVIKLLGGPFQPNRPEHQMLGLGIAGAFATRMFAEHQAFWFPNRDAPAGAMLGFPAALLPLAPFDEVMRALIQGNLARLEDLSTQIRARLAQVRFNPTGTMSLGGAGAPPRLGPEDYQQMLDPGVLQFVAMDPAKVKTTFESKPDALARDVKDALGRVQPPMPQEVRQQFEQIIGVLQRMDPAKAVVDQLERGPQVVELMAHLTATVDQTGCVAAEFWAGLFIPMLFIGVPQQFPPLDEEELEKYQQGAVDPLELFVDVVPYAHKAPEGGLLDAFEPKAVTVPHPNFEKVGLPPRLLQLNPAGIKGLLEQFSQEKNLDAVARFTKYLGEKAGKPAELSPHAKEALQVAMMALGDLKRLVTTAQGGLFLRRMTVSEASFEEPLARVRRVLQGGRIILTS
jgi:hypothetical protein